MAITLKCWFAVIPLFVCFFTPKGHALNCTVLQPIKDGSEVGLILVPGANIEGVQYIPLAKAIQVASPFKLWIGLTGGYVLHTPNPLEISSAVAMALGDMMKLGMKTKKVFMSAHSLGGVFLSSFVKSNPNSTVGMMLFGSYLTKGNKLSEFPVPVLTISGDLDGLNRITRIADTFQELQEDYTIDPNAIYRTPVITIEGINHGQFASGTLPAFVTSNDLPAEQLAMNAHTTIAGNVTSFMVSVLQEPSNMLSDARLMLLHSFFENAERMRHILGVKALDGDQKTSPWSIMAQTFAATFNQTSKEEIELNITNAVVSRYDLLLQEPSISLHGSLIDIQTYTSITTTFNPLDVSYFPVSPSEIQLIMKSRDSVKALSPNATFVGPEITCKLLNLFALNTANLLASNLARQRYVSRGKPMSFQDDIMMKTAYDWEAQSLKLSKTNSSLEVTSNSFISSVKSTALPGMHYCNLLSPFRALEWIYIDSLKK